MSNQGDGPEKQALLKELNRCLDVLMQAENLSDGEKRAALCEVLQIFYEDRE
ncbi:hypothetical protein OAO01_05220 [Oligoflexia bacterium]|nr:hypothetical protein [Oligoflexia bacterium]